MFESMTTTPGGWATLRVMKDDPVCVAGGSRADAEALAARASTGDRAAFDRLYEVTVGRVYAVCLRMCGSVPHAEELTQDAYVRVWRSLPSFRGDSAFTSWLHRLTVNVVLEDARKRKRRSARVETVPDVTKLASGSRPMSDARMDLERAIRALPERARTVLVLHDVEGYKHEEIAERMGIAAGTSKAQLHRARRLLREALER
jgi:RNA polymerase sigma-70 factor (ECF subfamily)